MGFPSWQEVVPRVSRASEGMGEVTCWRMREKDAAELGSDLGFLVPRSSEGSYQRRDVRAEQPRGLEN